MLNRTGIKTPHLQHYNPRHNAIPPKGTSPLIIQLRVVVLNPFCTCVFYLIFFMGQLNQVKIYIGRSYRCLIICECAINLLVSILIHKWSFTHSFENEALTFFSFIDYPESEIYQMSKSFNLLDNSLFYIRKSKILKSWINLSFGNVWVCNIVSHFFQAFSQLATSLVKIIAPQITYHPFESSQHPIGSAQD